MNIKINDKEMNLNNNEVKRARKISSEFLKNIEETSTKHTQKSFYFTTLIVMHVLTQQLLDEMDADTLSKYMKMVTDLRNNTPRV